MNPIPAWIDRLWNVWDIRLLVLWSLTLQIILVIFGGRRKYIRGIWIQIIVWVAYLMADWVAIFALSKLSDSASQGDSSSRSNKDGPNSALMALWAPLLLLHLGGPDTITVFSVEDIQLRNFVGLVVQVALVIYIFLRCWTQHSHSPLILSIPMFVAGVIKYGERTWVLWAANSVFPRPHFPVKYARAHTLDQIEGNDPNLKLLVRSNYLLETLACLQGGDDELMNSMEARAKLTELLKGSSVGSTEIFRVIEIQLGLMYDLFYTKATSIYCTTGCLLRLISFICVVTVLVAFSILRKGAEYSKVDIDITYLLLVGALLLELYGIALMISSEWMILWMLLRCIQLRILAFLAVYNLKGRRWSGVVGQLDYPGFRHSADQKKPPLIIFYYRILRLLGMGYPKSRSFCCQSYVHDFDDMKIVIIKWVRERVGKIGEIEPVGIERPGVLALKRYGLLRYLEQPIRLSFSETIVQFHLLTEACYEEDHSLAGEGSDKKNSQREASKLMSRYMLYFLTMYPSVFEGSVPLESYSQEYGSTPSFMYLSFKEQITRKANKWEILSELWAEMLCHGAARCPLNHHYENIRRGGEFLTHVWLLLTWHGLTDVDSLAFYFLQGCARRAVRHMDSS